MKRRCVAAFAASVAITSIAGCAGNKRADGTFDDGNASRAETQRYSGRLSLVLEPAAAAQNAAQSFSGAFELRGNAQTGELDLLTPLGSMALQLRWTPGAALLTRANETQQFSSAQALLEQATGVSLQLDVLFAWLQGKNTASLPSGGWQVDLSRHGEGRISAYRFLPSAAQLRIILDPR